jgi:hypothetical protein
MPSLACLRDSAKGESEYHFILARPSTLFDREDAAVGQAMSDFSESCRVDDATGSAEAMGRHLVTLGYVRIEGPRIVREEA